MFGSGVIGVHPIRMLLVAFRWASNLALASLTRAHWRSSR